MVVYLLSGEQFLHTTLYIFLMISLGNFFFFLLDCAWSSFGTYRKLVLKIYQCFFPLKYMETSYLWAIVNRGLLDSVIVAN